MKTHSIRIRRRLEMLGDELPLVALWMAAFAGIELVGRRSRSEFSDAVGVVVVLALILTTGLRHVRRPLRVVSRLKVRLRRLAHRLKPFRIRVGLDLRQEPPLPRRIPPALELALLLALVVPPALLVGRGALPAGLRGLLRGLSPSLHTVWLTLSWSVLAMAIVWQFWGPLSYLGDALKRSTHWRGHRREVQLLVGTGYLLWLLVGCTWLAAWLPLALAALALVPLAALAHAPHAPRLTMIWRRADGSSLPAGLPWTWLTSGMFVANLGASTTLVILAVGDGLGGSLSAVTPVSHFLGLALAWTTPAHLWTAVFHLGRILWQGRREDPAQALPPRVYVDGAMQTIERRRIRKALEPAGFDVAFPPTPRDPSDVQLTIADDQPANVHAEPETGPLVVALEDVASARLRVALVRRHELLQRELVVLGLRRALAAPRLEDDDDEGDAWIAPQYWFVTHVTRGEEEREQLVGRPYRELIPLRARHYAHVVLRRLEIDLVVVEHGVRFDELERVLAVLFEYHDVFGGERLADERPFSGLPRLRVVIHDHVLDEPFRAKGYPEPDYDSIGRARILHVFRDRGGSIEDASVPFDLDWEPTPVEPVLVV